MLKRERAIAGLGILLSSTIAEVAPTVTAVVVSERTEFFVANSLKLEYREQARLAGFTLIADETVPLNVVELRDPNGRVAATILLE